MKGLLAERPDFLHVGAAKGFLGNPLEGGGPEDVRLVNRLLLKETCIGGGGWGGEEEIGRQLPKLPGVLFSSQHAREPPPWASAILHTRVAPPPAPNCQ